MNLCYIECNWATSLLNEQPIPIKHNTQYLLIGESKYLKNQIIIEETNTASPMRLLVPKEFVVIEPR